MAIKRIIGFVVVFTLVALAMETPLAFVNIPSVIIVFGLIIGGALASGLRLTGMISISWNKNATEADLWDASDTYRSCSKLAMASGAVGTLIGLVLMLGNMNDPADIGPGLAISLLTALYAVVLKYFVFEPISAGFEKRAMDTPFIDSVLDESLRAKVVAPDIAEADGQEAAK